MPKTYLTKQEKLNIKLSAYIYGTMRAKRISQSRMAELMGITQPSLNRKLRLGKFTFQDLVVVFDVLKPDAETLTQLMGVSK